MPSVTDIIECPIEQVWAMLSDFGGLMRWHPQLVGCVTHGAGIGSERVVTLVDGRTATERLEELDPDQHVLVYSVTATANPAMVGATGRIQLASAGPDRTRVTWTFGLPESHPAASAENARLAAYYPQRIAHLRAALAQER
jgi:carbon monoxide dehydrogenase subunit G